MKITIDIDKYGISVNKQKYNKIFSFSGNNKYIKIIHAISYIHESIIEILTTKLK